MLHGGVHESPRSKSRGQDGCVWGCLPLPLENTPPPQKQFNQPQPTTYERRKTKRGDGFQKQQKNNNNCFLQYFFFYSCFFFLLLFYFFKTLKLESSVAPHTASFFRLAELYTLWKSCMNDTKNNNNSNNENLLYVGGNFTWSFLLWSVGFLSFFKVKMPFCFSLSPLYDIPLSVPSFYTQIK